MGFYRFFHLSSNKVYNWIFYLAIFQPPKDIQYPEINNNLIGLLWFEINNNLIGLLWLYWCFHLSDKKFYFPYFLFN